MRKRKRKKNNTYGSSLKRKVLLLILGILLLVGLVVFQYKKKEEAEERRPEAQEELQENVLKQEAEVQETDGTKEKGTEEDVPKSGTQEEQSEKSEAVIINLDEYAAKLMGENAELLNERLTEWVEEYRLNVTEGTIIHVMVPKSDPQSINFYIRLSDERSSLILLSYHPRENIVTASQCAYTEEEVMAEVWEGDNGPAVRDVPPEEDTGGAGGEENQGEENQGGENMEQEGAETDGIAGEN